MSKTAENLLKLEQEAQELVMKLKTLNEQIGSYKEAKDSLQETSQNLSSLVRSITQLTQESQSIISKFNEISGAGFIEQTKEINTNISQYKNAMTGEHEQLVVALQGLGKNLADSQSQILNRVTEANKKNRILLLAIIGGVVLVVLLLLVHMFLVR